ncbi:hypothetical protein K402DRAFT_416935 [Aulographum hederae CBS 113979]|uniref:RGS domain-containing protein n=1 Tax=Aulographum hederae CBS 113979 TaxID=1176131 RepID=A0A6G1HFE8_9PEZI|nr:hypothetical protein K402DRAFT_416935 [Aulographum hederae CBS 113979]
MVYSLLYRRPSHVSSSRASLSGEEKQKSITDSVGSGSSGMSHGIPDALSFDRIIAGGVCPPCTVRDFMNYLKYIEHAAENLQFFLWHKDYTKRFNELPDSEKKLAPEWTMTKAESEALAAQMTSRPKSNLNPAVQEVFKGTDFAPPTKPSDNEKANPFYTPPRTPSEETRREDDASFVTSEGRTSASQTTKTTYAKKAGDAFDDAGLKWQPFTIQPFREEVSRIITIYISDGAPRQLNLSAKERTALLHALENTTHPTAFKNILTTVEFSLRSQNHPNFIRWTICNGNRPRVIFARGLGVGGIVGGLIAAIIITLSSAGRAYRVLSAIGFMIGIATLIAAWKGMCVVLHGMHHRHLRPWELFGDDVDEELELKNASLDSLATKNSYEDEPWVARYDKRNVIRKVFDREVWIEEPALRQIQDTIFIQAIIGAFVITAVSVGIFCAVPKGNFF